VDFFDIGDAQKGTNWGSPKLRVRIPFFFLEPPVIAIDFLALGY